MLFGTNWTRICCNGKVSYVSASAMEQLGTVNLVDIVKLFPSGSRIVTSEDKSKNAVEKKIIHRSIKILMDIFIDALMAFITFFFINLLTHETHVATITGWVSFAIYVILFFETKHIRILRKYFRELRTYK